MEKISKEYDSGIVKITKYTRADIEDHRHIRAVIDDLYTNLPNFDLPIYWLVAAYPNAGYEMSNVIKDYLTAEGSDKFIMCQAGTVTTGIPFNGPASKALKFISEELRVLFGLGFAITIFNRKMAQSYAKREICLYQNDVGKQFVTENTGIPTTNKIINRVSTY